jgi:HD-GYP domain-containing protein (c-di-GMP phosphodiesterase class II)
MRTDRSYRRALAYDVSLHELISNSGTQFDPRVVKILVEIVREEEPAPSPLPAAESDTAPPVLIS